MDVARLTTVLVVNAGSSSLKLHRVDPTGAVAAGVEIDRWDGAGVPDALAEVLGGEPVDVVGHRVVHGGRELSEATLITPEVLRRIEELAPLAPLHQPRALAGIRFAQEALGGVPHVACFDTAFHRTLSPAARTYALPADWRRRWDLGRFGFHGLSHRWAAHRAVELSGGSPGERVVTCHLGAGASLCAVLRGRSVDTTMGFTPLEGLVMATRSGSVDPGLLLWLQAERDLGAAELADGLEHHAGLAGLSGTSGDMRDVLAARAAGDRDAGLAFDVYIHRLRREVAAMAAALGGVDGLAFTGGVGEHAPAVRAAAAEGLRFLGVAVDASANEAADGDADITAPAAPVRTVVVTAREHLEIARQVRELLAGSRQPPGAGSPE